MDALVAQWQKDHKADKKPLSMDDLMAQTDTILQGLRTESQIESLKAQINASNLSDALKQKLLDRINSEMGGVNPNYLTWNLDTVHQLDSILKGEWGEFQVAKMSDDISLKVRNCLQSGTDPYDMDALQGNSWVEVKNATILGPGNSSYNDVLAQLAKYFQVIQSCPGSLPRPINNIILDVPPGSASGLQGDLTHDLENMGIPNPHLEVNQVNYGDPPTPQADWCK